MVDAGAGVGTDSGTHENTSAEEAGDNSDAQGWKAGTVSAAQPLFTWPNRTGVATMSFIAAIGKYVMVVGTPSHGLSMIRSFDTYFLESDAITGPFRLIDYWREFGPQAYFVGVPTAFASPSVETDPVDGTRYVEVTLSYSANFHPGGSPSPAGSGGGWDLRRARLVLS